LFTVTIDGSTSICYTNETAHESENPVHMDQEYCARWILPAVIIT